jgi:hypothetical protein
VGPGLGPVRVGPIASAAATFPEVVRETEVPSGAAPGDSTAQTRVATAIAALPVGDPAAAVLVAAVDPAVVAASAVAVVEAAAGAVAAGSRADFRTTNCRSTV